MIEVTEVKIFPIKNPVEGSKTKAFASVTLNEEFLVKSMKVIDGAKGLFVSFPQEKNKKTNEWYDVCHPITAGARTLIIDAVLNKYNDNAEVPVGEENQASDGKDPWDE